MTMSVSVRAAKFCAGLLAATALVAPAWAQTPAETSAEQNADNGEIIVTARLRNERLQDVPVAITALPAAQLERYQVTSVTDMSSFVPGMVVGRQVTGSSASIFLRGVGSTSLSAGFDQSVSFNVDGLAMSRGREIMFAQYDLAQIEVLKGPQALFFGRNTTGGLINITSKNPTDHFEAGIKGGYGFEGREVYGEGFISGPISDSFRGRLAFRASDSQGPFINTAPATTIDPANGLTRHRIDKRRGGSQTISGRLTLQYDAGSDFDATFKAGITRYKDDGASELYERKCGAGRTVPRPIAGPLGTFSDPAADCVVDGRADHSTEPPQVAATQRYGRNGVPYTDLKTESALLNLHYVLDGVNLTSITAFYHFNQQDLNDFVGSTRAQHVTQYADFKQFSEELRLQTDSSGPLNATAGIFFAKSHFIFNTEVWTNGRLADANGRYATFDRNNGFKGTTISGFGELRFKPMENFEIAGGARYSADEKNSYQLSLPNNAIDAATFPPGIAFKDHYTEDNVSPQVTATFKATPDISIYAAYKQGYKAGGYDVSHTILAATKLSDSQFKSEGAKGYEVGVHGQALDRQLRFNLTAYHYKYTDLQVQFYNPDVQGSVVQNLGSLITKGVEADFNFALRDSPLSLHGALAYNDAKYGKVNGKSFNGQCYSGQSAEAGCDQDPNPLLTSITAGTAARPFNAQVFTGRTPPKAPKWGIQLGTGLDFDLPGGLHLGMTGDAKYTSKYNYTDTLRPDAVQNGVTKFDASVSLSGNNDMWKVSVIGRNLTDKLTVTTANEMTGTGSGNGRITSAPFNNTVIPADMNTIVEHPREIFVEVSFKF